MKEKTMAKYVVADGFVVAGKSGGEEVKERDVQRMDVLVESGRVIRVDAKSSATIKGVPNDASEEDQD
jgi:hypothetical protein